MNKSDIDDANRKRLLHMLCSCFWLDSNDINIYTMKKPVRLRNVKNKLKQHLPGWIYGCHAFGGRESILPKWGLEGGCGIVGGITI